MFTPMKTPVNILIVDNNHARNSEKERVIKENGISSEVRIAVNAGHALLYLDHIHLNRKIQDSNLVIILNMETPISDGYEFLNSYGHSSNLQKEKIHIIVVNENLCEEKQAKIKKLGVSDFIPDSFPVSAVKEIIEKRFSSSAPVVKKAQKIKNEHVQARAAAGM